MPQRQAQKFLQNSVEIPIFVSLAAAVLVVLGTFFAGLSYSHQHSRTEDAEAISGVFRLLGDSRARELKMETVWSDAYVNSRSLNLDWMNSFYGAYLSNLLDYDEIYVLDDGNKPVFAFQDGQRSEPSSFDAKWRPIDDLVATLRSRNSRVAHDSHPATTAFDLGKGQIAEHRIVSDVRRIGNRPALVIVETIVPDAAQPGQIAARPFLLVAVDYLLSDEVSELGRRFGFQDLHWTEVNKSGRDELVVRAANGTPVGTLVWSKADASGKFAAQVSIAVAVALALFAGIAFLAVRRGRQGAAILKRSLNALSSLNETLERRVAERTKELEVTLANIDQGVIMVQANNELAVVNARAEEILEVASKREVAIFLKNLRTGAELPESLDTSDDAQKSFPENCQLRRPDGLSNGAVISSPAGAASSRSATSRPKWAVRRSSRKPLTPRTWQSPRSRAFFRQ